MKTKVVPLIGDPIENLYQLGLLEREAFLKIESRVTKLLSTNPFLSYGQDILSRAKVVITQKEKKSFYKECITSYAKGMGIDPIRYFSFLSLFEIAAHYGQTYPELKGIIPGCSSVMQKKGNDFIHTRLLDFPLVGIYEENPRLYLWQASDKAKVLSYSSAGLAPLFLQGLHESGTSFALHHKPGQEFHQSGESIFEILFDNLLNSQDTNDFRKNLKKKSSVTKWGILLLNKEGQAYEIDIDGPAQNHEAYDLNDTASLLFTNVPLKQETKSFEEYIAFTESRQSWLSGKLSKNEKAHILDTLTDVSDQKPGPKWQHPAATLSTVGGYSVNLTKGLLDFKEGNSVLVASDKIYQLNLGEQNEIKILKEVKNTTSFEIAWKKLALAQSNFDQGLYDMAYHQIYMAQALMPNEQWKDIIAFYIACWDFKFLRTNKELLQVYKGLKKLKLPVLLKDQALMLTMRFEKKLGLVLTVKEGELSPHNRGLFKQETEAHQALFATWMKLLYPRIEILNIFSPHSK